MNKIEKWKQDYKNYDKRCPEIREDTYLLENNHIMHDFLKSANLIIEFETGNCIHNKSVPNSGIQGRPDWRFEKEKIIIEFDGVQHYQSPDWIKRDRQKDEIYSKMGYKVIRIPFFIQPSTETLKHYFNIDKKLELKYPHGFIIYDSTPPSYFCSLGLKRFKKEIENLPKSINQDILKSLNKLVELGSDIDYIIPEEIRNIF